MTTLTRWLLRAFADEWPGANGSSGRLLDGDADGGPLRLADRNDSMVLDVDTATDPTTFTERAPSEDYDLTRSNILGVAFTGNSDTPAGLGGSEYRREPVLSVRIEAGSAREGGHVRDNAEFQALWETALDVVKQIDNGTLQAAPLASFHVADPGAQNPQMSNYKDAYEYQFDVEPEGYQQL
jgi:hypothetical protein